MNKFDLYQHPANIHYITIEEAWEKLLKGRVLWCQKDPIIHNLCQLIDTQLFAYHNVYCCNSYYVFNYTDFYDLCTKHLWRLWCVAEPKAAIPRNSFITDIVSSKSFMNRKGNTITNTPDSSQLFERRPAQPVSPELSVVEAFQELNNNDAGIIGVYNGKFYRLLIAHNNLLICDYHPFLLETSLPKYTTSFQLKPTLDEFRLKYIEYKWYLYVYQNGEYAKCSSDTLYPCTK